MQEKKFEITFTDSAEAQLLKLEKDKAKQRIYKVVMKTLGLMQSNLRHPSLNTHEHSRLSREYGYKIFESYAQNKTPGAYRVFWRYSDTAKDEIIIVAIVPHP